jgi:hypothetical protein
MSSCFSHFVSSADFVRHLQVKRIGVSNFTIDHIKGITKTGLEKPVRPVYNSPFPRFFSYHWLSSFLIIDIDGFLDEASFITLITLVLAGRESDRNASFAVTG